MSYNIEFMKMLIDAFETFDWIEGTESGGIEAPRIFMAAEIKDDGTALVTWRHPETCGLSDCRYHYEDTTPQVDVFRYDYEKDTLTLNGNENIFGISLFNESRKMANNFYARWKLSVPATYAVKEVA